MCVGVVIHGSACVVYASSMLDYARDTRQPSVVMRRNWFETAHAHIRPLTPHLHITHEPRTYHVYPGTKVLVRRTFAIHASGMRRMLVKYCTVFARMRRRALYFIDSSVIVNDRCTVHASFMRDSSVISTPDTPNIWSISRRKHAQTQYVRDL